MSLQQAIKEAFASAPTNIVTLHTIEMNHAAFTEPIRVVLDYVVHDLLLEDETIATFIPFSFSFDLPEISDSGVSELNIKVDNISKEVSDNLELSLATNDHITVVYRPYLFDKKTGTQPVGAEGPQMNPPLVMKAKTVLVNEMSVSMVATFNDIVNRKFPADLYTLTRFPGLIR